MLGGYRLEVREEEYQAGVLAEEYQAEVWVPGMLGGNGKPPRKLGTERDQHHLLHVRALSVLVVHQPC